MKYIVVSVTNDLTTDQRVHKICMTLQKEGYNISLIGRKLKTSISIKRTYKTSRMSLFFNKGFLFYAEYNIRLFLKIIFVKKDILIANDLDTLLPNYCIYKLFRTKLVYDSHELFTEIPELINRPQIQNIWVLLEKSILPKLKNTYTVCNSIANYYNKKYNTKFKVIKNTPIKIERQTSFFPFETKNKKIILYQGAVNVGRGLELMIDTMKYISDCIFVIIGTGDIFEELQEKVTHLQLNKSIKFMGKVTPKELCKLTPLSHLGISIEEDLGLNYRYALPNKIFDYLQAGVPILISNLPEMRKIVIDYNVGKIVTDRNPQKLAECIVEIFDNQTKYNLWRKNTIKAAENFTWEKESEKLIYFYKNLRE